MRRGAGQATGPVAGTLLAAAAGIVLAACGRAGGAPCDLNNGDAEATSQPAPIPAPVEPEAATAEPAPEDAVRPPPAREAEPLDAGLAGPVFHVPLGDSPWKGASEPLAVLIVFIDFSCPHCARMAPVLDQLVAAHPDELRAVYKAYPIPGHGKAPEAAVVAAAAHAQGRFWEMHDLLFANPGEWTTEDLERLAIQAGLNPARFRDALEDERVRAEVAADVTAGHRIGVTGTPSFVLNGRRFEGSLPFAKLEARVTAAIAEGRARLEAGVPRGEVYEDLTADGLPEAPQPPLPACAAPGRQGM
ncbi:MAG: thioredoxin domain-containing protein [Deltaproteobacteria bacterium]|nr:thioredoxin domain-containing protein [Deltaproteobacteria bacterium]